MKIPRRLLAVLLAALASLAQASVEIDATAPVASPHALPFAAGGTSPSGHALTVNDRCFMRDGQPWFPVMGEFHFARYPESEWETELLKMKAGGIDIVGTYVFWIFHEEQEGKFDWSGQRNLRKFIELCGKHGLYVWLRIGPWAHGEARNGGFPDWLVAGGPVRENDPTYLGHVQRFFGQIGEQVKGQFWKDGGPIAGVQLENEYHPAKDGEAHLAKLLELARGAGMDAPFYTITGWDKATLPASGFLPVFSGYTDQFWSDSRTELPPNSNFFFTPIRAEDNVSYLLQPKDRAYHDRYLPYPFLTAEMGAGMATAYHRRPVMQADDSTAAALVKLGSGASLLGYYMYHGGTNPEGHGPLSESFTGWNGYNELEVKSYDFQAPIGAYGQVRQTYRTMKLLHLFLHDFGAALAPMAAYFPSESPRSLDDAITPRVALRSDGRSGFVFINNYQRSHPSPPHPGFQVAVKLASGTVRLPRQPITLPGGVYTHWPVNLPLPHATLCGATAQLVCHLEDPDTYVFCAAPGVPIEFDFALESGTTLAASRARVSDTDRGRFVSGVEPGREPAMTLRTGGGAVTTIIVLSHADGLNLWKSEMGGREQLLISPAALEFVDGRVQLEARRAEELRVAAYPELPGRAPTAATGCFAEYVMSAPDAPPELATVRQVKPALPAEPVRLNADPKRAVALEPTDADFARASVWSIQLPERLVTGDAPAFLRIRYQGDVARLYAGERLLTDNFYKGTPFEVGLWRLTPEERRAGLTLKILPLRRDAPIYLPRAAWPKFNAHGEALILQPPEIVTRYRATFDLRQK
jgi:hypothetical protein